MLQLIVDLIVGKKAKEPLPIDMLLDKFALIMEVSHYEVFQIAAEAQNWPAYHVERDFKKHLDTFADWYPPYLISFLEEGREVITNYRFHKWVL